MPLQFNLAIPLDPRRGLKLGKVKSFHFVSLYLTVTGRRRLTARRREVDRAGSARGPVVHARPTGLTVAGARLMRGLEL